jgi:hypothetical protein
MLTPLDADAERLASGPCDILCLIQSEKTNSFCVAILQARGVSDSRPPSDETPTIELEVEMTSPLGDLKQAQEWVQIFAERYGFQDQNVATDRAIWLGDPSMPITVQNWNNKDKPTTARSALFSVVDSVSIP